MLEVYMKSKEDRILIYITKDKETSEGFKITTRIEIRHNMEITNIFEDYIFNDNFSGFENITKKGSKIFKYLFEYKLAMVY
jgi:hypothetical protein